MSSVFLCGRIQTPLSQIQASSAASCSAVGSHGTVHISCKMSCILSMGWNAVQCHKLQVEVGAR